MTKKEKDAEKFAKNMVKLEQHLGRDLRPDEAMLLALFASVINASEEDDKKEDAPNAMPWEQAADLAISLAFLGVALRIDQESKSKKASKPETEVTLTSCPLSSDVIKDLFNHKEDKND